MEMAVSELHVYGWGLDRGRKCMPGRGEHEPRHIRVSKGRWLSMRTWTPTRGPRHLHPHQSGAQEGAAGVAVLVSPCAAGTELTSSQAWELLEARGELCVLPCPAWHCKEGSPSCSDMSRVIPRSA